MATRAISLQAATPQDLETMTMAYIAQGFSVMNKTPAQVTLFRQKQFSTTWLIIDLVLIFFFGFGLLLLIIYLIIYAAQSDDMVTITIASMAAPPYGGYIAQQPYSGPLPQQPYSGPLPRTIAPQQWMSAPRSPDGQYWWDGRAWQPIPSAAPSGPMPQPPTIPTQE